MRTIFRKYKSVLLFLGLFFGSYLVLSGLYGGYLHLSEESAYKPDLITHLVAKQSTAVIRVFEYEAMVAPHPDKPTMKLYVNGDYLARIIEGCNSVSIIILFMAFVIAFAQQWKKTLLYLLTGAVLIYSVNLIRIAVLAIALYEYPQHASWLHGIVFPGLIYGMVFLLWIVWVRQLKPIANKHE
ncbi:exosortase family protein XrtF [Altibacter sp. HG106]|uniref:exosortase family protein XrtF n=1 Tax=Altibacter sp. HG106 TaxID=3023937 RepID=UPI003FA42A21